MMKKLKKIIIFGPQFFLRPGGAHAVHSLATPMLPGLGFTSVADKQRLKASACSVIHAIRLSLYKSDDPSPTQLAADLEGKLFANIQEQSSARFVRHAKHQIPIVAAEKMKNNYSGILIR